MFNRIVVTAPIEMPVHLTPETACCLRVIYGFLATTMYIKVDPFVKTVF